MNILVTNSRLNTLGGSETFVRDLGRSLRERGHSVIAFSTEPLRKSLPPAYGMIQSVSSIEDLPFFPDVIHGQHHLEAMTALLALPGVPMAYLCQGAVWRDKPPQHPRILQYLTISRTMRERLIVESNLPPERISVCLNSVDLKRFSLVRPPPDKLRKAVIYNKIHDKDSPTLHRIVEAASKLGMELDFIGKNFGRLIHEPEKVLPEYDLVFASGRSAIDALACGCAVVVLGRRGCGPLVVPDNFAFLREVNFTIPVNSAPAQVEKIQQNLLEYDPSRQVEVIARLRKEADFERTIDFMESVYAKCVAEQQHAKTNPEEEVQATYHYLRSVAPLVRGLDLVMDCDWVDEQVP